VWDQALQAYAQDNRDWDLPPHPFATVVTAFTCPADARARLPGDYHGLKTAYTSYLGVEGEAQFRLNGVLYLDSHVRLTDITDGTSNTLMAGERPAPPDEFPFGWWYAGGGQGGTGSAGMALSARERNISVPWCPPGPYAYGPGRADNACDAFHFWSYHPGGAYFLFADGSVHFLNYSAGPLLPALASRNGGEVVQVPD
jgi:prepilin-type processing-associated H-X9-DG protein